MDEYESLQEPIFWIENSRRLELSARVIKDKLDSLLNKRNIDPFKSNQEKLAYLETYMMLMGYSTENLLKGLAIKVYLDKNPDATFKNLADLKNKVWKVKSGHELRSIAENCGIELYRAEKELLTRYETFLQWAGRYPIPQNKELYKEAVINGKRKSLASDDEILTQLKFKIERKYGR